MQADAAASTAGVAAAAPHLHEHCSAHVHYQMKTDIAVGNAAAVAAAAFHSHAHCFVHSVYRNDTESNMDRGNLHSSGGCQIPKEHARQMNIASLREVSHFD